jgi:hypothetical protein
LHPAGKQSIVSKAILVFHRYPDAGTSQKWLGPLRLKIVVTASMALEGVLQGLRREGIHVGILQAQVANVPRRSELNADQMSGVFPSPPGHGTLRGDDVLSRDFAGNAEFP